MRMFKRTLHQLVLDRCFKHKQVCLIIMTILLLLITFNSCVYLLEPYRKKFKKHSICYYDCLAGGIDSLIKINGFYTNTNTQKAVRPMPSFVFYNDGTFSKVPWSDDYPIFSNISNINISEHTEKYKKNFLSFKKYDLLGGMYVIKNDTIICEYVEPDFYEGTMKFRYTFKVVDKETIELISKEILNRNSDLYDDFSKAISSNKVWKFYPGTNKPDSINTYDRNLRYRWSSIRKWREYKHKLKKQ